MVFKQGGVQVLLKDEDKQASKVELEIEVKVKYNLVQLVLKVGKEIKY